MNKFNFDENDVGSLYGAARNVNCPIDVLVKLAGDKSRDVRSAVEKNPNCPNELKIKLASEEKDLLERIGVANNSNSPADILAKLAEDKEFDVRYAVAKNISCPVDVLVKLVSDECSDVRHAVARNPNCPAALLTELVLGKLGNFRATVARNVNCPMDVLVKLAEDREPYIRIDVTKNKNCPTETLVKLSGDEEPEVRYAVAKSLNCPAEAFVKLAGDKYHLVRCAVAENANCPGELLSKLAKSKVESIRVAVADNLVCPVELLEKLARDKSCNVRYAVADNPSCTVELMEIALNGNHGAPEVIKSIQPLKLPKLLELLRKRIESTVKPFIAMKELGDTLPDEFILGSLRERTFQKKLRLWQSKVCGFPYFPKSHEYPTGPNGRPLLLLIQINFADVPKLDLFPEKGMLQIYLGDADRFLYGKNYDNPTDQSYFRILFFPEVVYDSDALITDFEFLPKDNSYMPCTTTAPIKFDLKHEPISAGDDLFEQAILGENGDDEIGEIYREKFRGSGSKIGGYPDFVQGDPRYNKNGTDEFILLVQFDGGFDMAWGNGGLANFFIRKSDLLKRDFSKVLYDWSCM